ncbi:uncharacterized protein LOC111085916 [Limulus polyphemus]|uniref:Uncharacterized protein LOC111085916 n=1 Tax=Limulus polyphemus TaxID=6850 RepID=A0ABM1SFQ1_LIMPO|nr:uncharacterized protein LOC111085916 [Limulus polyphemus]
MRLMVLLLLVCCFLPVFTSAITPDNNKNEASRQDAAATGIGTNILTSLTNLLSPSSSSSSPLILLLLLPLLSFLYILSAAGPLFSSLINSGLGNLGNLGPGSLPGLLTGTGVAAAANPGFYYRKQRSANVDGGSAFWDILTTVEDALKKYENGESNSQF